MDSQKYTTEKYITDRLDNQIDWYGNKSSTAQKKYKVIKAAEIIISALIPVIALLDQDTPLYIQIMLGIMGGTIVVLSNFQSIGKYHENWIEYRSVSETLKHEKYLYETKTGTYCDLNNDTETFNLLVERVESIISHENINWSQMNNQKNESR